MPYHPCTHLTDIDYIVRKDGKGKVWKCSCCDDESYWSEGHGLWGSIECKSCGGPDIDWIVCSSHCERIMKKKHGITE